MKMKKTKKRVASFVLAFLMVASLFTGMGSMEVNAADRVYIDKLNISLDISKIPELRVGDTVTVDTTLTDEVFSVSTENIIISNKFIGYVVDESNKDSPQGWNLSPSTYDSENVFYAIFVIDSDKDNNLYFKNDMPILVNGTSSSTLEMIFNNEFERVFALKLGTLDEIAEAKNEDQSAPTGLSDGKGAIAGTTTAMEYSTSENGDYTTCTDGSTTVPAGTYYVRLAKKDGYNASPAVKVTVTAKATTPTTPTTTVDTSIAEDAPIGNVAGIESAYKDENLVTENNKGYTAADKAIVDAGGSAKIWLNASVTAAGEETTGSKAATAKLTVDGYKTGLVLDLNVWKEIKRAGASTGTQTQLIELPEVIAVTVDIPTELQGKSEYVIYRYHEDSVDVLSATKNADGEYIEVSSDGKQLILHVKKFSDYVLGYKEATATTPTTATSPKTGDTTPMIPLAVLMFSGMIGIAVIIRKRKETIK